MRMGSSFVLIFFAPLVYPWRIDMYQFGSQEISFRRRTSIRRAYSVAPPSRQRYDVILFIFLSFNLHNLSFTSLYSYLSASMCQMMTVILFATLTKASPSPCLDVTRSTAPLSGDPYRTQTLPPEQAPT